MINRLTLSEMSRLIKDREISSAELVDAHWAEIERQNPKLNAFVIQLPSESRAEARRLDRERWSGPLHGIPLTIKDSFDIRGLPTLCGSRFRLDHRADHDSTVVRKLRDAGAIILGKTNCPEFLANWETDNYITGRTNNPWRADRTSGGSSGGESAAIASYCSAGGVGSDGGGSIRVPAHFCGIAGLKPTPGRISAAGHFPEIGNPGGLLGVAGPMARTAQDLAILFQTMSGYDALDPFSAPVPPRKFERDGLRVGMMMQFGTAPVQDAAKHAIAKAAKLLQTIGALVDEFKPNGLEHAAEVWWFFFGELPSVFTRELVALDEENAHWTGTELMEMVPVDQLISGRRVVEMLAARDRMRAELLRAMEKIPVLLLPVCGVPAFAHRERRWKTADGPIGLLDAMSQATPFNLIGFPGVAIPMDITTDGLPVGIQLVGRPWEEEMLLDLAVKLEEARGPLPGPPI